MDMSVKLWNFTGFDGIYKDFYRFLRDLLGFDGFLIIFDMFFCVGFMI